MSKHDTYIATVYGSGGATNKAHYSIRAAFDWLTAIDHLVR